MLNATNTDALGSLGSLAKVATDQLLGWTDPTGFLASQLNPQANQACLEDFTFDSFGEQTVPGSLMFLSFGPSLLKTHHIKDFASLM